MLIYRSYLQTKLPGVAINTQMLINIKRLVMQRKRFPDKVPNPRCGEHETDTTLNDWFTKELRKALESNCYAFIEILENFTDIDPGFLFRVILFDSLYFYSLFFFLIKVFALSYLVFLLGINMH